MTRTTKQVLLLTILAAVATAADRDKPITNWANLNVLTAGAEVRVDMAGGKSLRGFLQRVEADTISVNATTSQETLNRADIRRVAVKRPGHRGRNTLIGFAIGAGGGLAAGAAADSQTNSGDFFPYAGKAVFTPLGMLIGTVIGVALPTGGWRDIYRAP